MIQAGLDGLHAFLLDVAVDVIPIENVSIMETFDQYFGSTPPFGLGSKKAEFPDAFSLLALLMWCDENNSRIYVVSNEKGVQEGCSQCETLIQLTTLDEFLDLAARQRELYAFANEIFIQLKPDILKEFAEEFQSIFFYIDEAESDVSDAEVKEIDITKELVISVDTNEALFEITADVTFTVNYSYADYIVEDVVVSQQEGTIERTIEVHAEVGLLYDQADPEVTQLHFVSIREDALPIDLYPDPYDLK